MSQPPAPSVRAYSARNTLRALEELALRPLSAPELATRLAIADRTARRMLQRLALEGYAAQGDWHHRRYAATFRLATLARRLLDDATLLRLASPTLVALAATGTATLWIPAGDDTAMCVLRCDRGTEVPEPTLGARTPVHTSAAGLALCDGVRDVAVTNQPRAVAAPIFELGAIVAAVALAPAAAGDRGRVALAARTITALLRDGVL